MTCSSYFVAHSLKDISSFAFVSTFPQHIPRLRELYYHSRHARVLTVCSFAGGSSAGAAVPPWIIWSNVTFTGTCPSTLQVLLDLAGPDGQAMAGVVSGTSCSGSVPRTGLALAKQ